MVRHLTLGLSLAVVLLLACASTTQGSTFVGDAAPIIVDVQGRVQRKNILIGYTGKFRVPGSEPFRRLQGGLCKTSRFRLGRPRYLRDALISCNLVTVSWNKPFVTLRLAFNRTILTERGLSGGSKAFFTLLRSNLERYRVCNCLDAFTGRLYLANARELIAVAAVEIEALPRSQGPVNHTTMATEILARFPPIFGLQSALRNVFFVEVIQLDDGPAYVYKFYFSEHVLSLNAVDIYCNDFRAIAYELLSKMYQRPKERVLSTAVVLGIDRAYEDSLDMNQLLKPSTYAPFVVDLNFIPEDAICQRSPKAIRAV